MRIGERFIGATNIDVGASQIVIDGRIKLKYGSVDASAARTADDYLARE